MLKAASAVLLLLQFATVLEAQPAREVVMRHAKAFAVSAEPVTVTLDVGRCKGKLIEASKSGKSTVVLEIEGVAADRSPGFILAVLVGGVRVGEVALYAIDQPQTFAFAADEAVAKSLRDSQLLEIRFVPESGLDGQPAHPEAPVRIAAISLTIENGP